MIVIGRMFMAGLAIFAGGAIVTEVEKRKGFTKGFDLVGAGIKGAGNRIKKAGNGIKSSFSFLKSKVVKKKVIKVVEDK